MQLCKGSLTTASVVGLSLTGMDGGQTVHRKQCEAHLAAAYTHALAMTNLHVCCFSWLTHASLQLQVQILHMCFTIAQIANASTDFAFSRLDSFWSALDSHQSFLCALGSDQS